MAEQAQERFDVVVVGGGHNGLVAAVMLARAGRSVLVLERSARLGGAAVSARLFDGVDARVSRYAYLISLFPESLRRKLGLRLDLRPRRIGAYSPLGASGLLIDRAGERTRASMLGHTGDPAEFERWTRFHAMLARVARGVFPTLTEPLRPRRELRRIVADDAAWNALFEEPLSNVLERTFRSDLVRGTVLTDALIGTFAPADDPLLRQNRCFLYHVIGNGTGSWDVPVGGMGALCDELANAARRAGAQLRTRTEVASIATDETIAEVTCAGGARFVARHVLAGVAPAVLWRLLGESAPAGATADAPEGAQLKINMLLWHLPRVRDPRVRPADAFAGTLHVNEGYDQLRAAYEEASRGRIPAVAPCEVYCHSLTDPSILSSELRDAGVHTLTLFGLHMPARVFTASPARAKQQAVAAALRSLDSVLAEPLEDCLLRAPDGTPCLEALTPPELEAELAMPGGHIFHRDLSWPFAESEQELDHTRPTWGVETRHANVWLCGAGARRGGGVSGIPGHNAARAVLEAS